MASAADVDDPGALAREQAIEQQSGQREMAEVIGAELHLETVGGETIRDRHDAGVVAEHVERLMAHVERVGETADRREVGKIERHHFDIGSRRRRDYLRGCSPRLAEIAACEDYLRPLARELERGLV